LVEALGAEESETGSGAANSEEHAMSDRTVVFIVVILKETISLVLSRSFLAESIVPACIADHQALVGIEKVQKIFAHLHKGH
jgi:hypothetical protein